MKFIIMKKLLLLILVLLPFLSNAQSSGAKAVINQQLDAWHKAAADVNADLYFGFLADDAIYIGTEKSERWDKEAFWEFARPYFEKGKTWDFTPYDRQIFISKNEEIAWFSELLETHMGICRGSGILTRDENQWKVHQYHLSVTLPNELVTDFVDLVESFEGEQKQ